MNVGSFAVGSVIKKGKGERDRKSEKGFLPVKHPLLLRAFAFKTGSIAFSEHGENLLLFLLSPDVARANIIKLPSSPPGVH